ncbi:MAG TPA: hypothetical protein VGM63_16800 [Mucilaginibacter sp.]|jgi:hypothetical protein
MLYYTQIIFVKKGKEDQFNLFESHVLPLLKKYNGILIYRVRPSDSAVIESTIDRPYELHVVTFPERKDFEGYSGDQERLQYMHLKEGAIEKVLLIEGKAL